jgi:hypothetical protein
VILEAGLTDAPLTTVEAELLGESAYEQLKQSHRASDDQSTNEDRCLTLMSPPLRANVRMVSDMAH